MCHKLGAIVKLTVFLITKKKKKMAILISEIVTRESINVKISQVLKFYYYSG